MTNFAQKIQEKEKYHAYVQGAKAFESGSDILDNPYTFETKEFQEWVDGYLDAKYIRIG